VHKQRDRSLAHSGICSVSAQAKKIGPRRTQLRRKVIIYPRITPVSDWA